MKDVHALRIAMPALLSHRAVQDMATSIDSHGLTRLQLKWGGTHDILVGVLLYVRSVCGHMLHAVFMTGYPVPKRMG